MRKMREFVKLVSLFIAISDVGVCAPALQDASVQPVVDPPTTAQGVYVPSERFWLRRKKIYSVTQIPMPQWLQAPVDLFSQQTQDGSPVCGIWKVVGGRQNSTYFVQFENGRRVIIKRMDKYEINANKRIPKQVRNCPLTTPGQCEPFGSICCVDLIYFPGRAGNGRLISLEETRDECLLDYVYTTFQPFAPGSRVFFQK
ncbi:MAG: hypothetical protein LBF66_02390 [Holosporales bacterium]|jgi:hypothetical protein|nr:hypothetical protein [Holosporales bacterium]